MNNILRLSFANIKKHKKESILFMILITLGMVLLSASVSSVMTIKKITPQMVKESGCFENFVQFMQKDYSDRFLSFLAESKDVESFEHTSVVTDIINVKNYQGLGDDMLVDLSFVPVSGEKKMEDFKTDADFSSAEHPIVIDNTKKADFEVSKGDELTIVWENKEFTFTVVGFYDAGIWNLGSKAIVSEEDFAYLENCMNRYEMVGINTVDGADNGKVLKDFKAFCEDLSINDISESAYTIAYEDTVSANNVNMSLLSIIILFMSSVIVIAIMIMIRFRIVSDIKEQIVSIGVLEALGYKSNQIAASYIAEYVLIAIISALISAVPSVCMAKGLLKNAAVSICYSGPVEVTAIPVFVCILAIILFVGGIACTKAVSVRKYPPVLAFRKGIDTHNFKKTILPLEKAGGNVHIRLALKDLYRGAKDHIGLSVCIMACTVMVLLGFMIGSFFGNSNRILNAVCGHELCDIRIETACDMEPEVFANELESMPEVEKVLLPAIDLGVKLGNDSATLEVYEDYSKTTTIIMTEGRLPEHENEVAFTVQQLKNSDVSVGETVTLDYGKVKKDYIITGVVNSAVDPKAVYLTIQGFKRMYPPYTPSTFDIYLNEDVNKDDFANLLRERYGKEMAEYKDDDAAGDTLEDRIRNLANKKMAEAMTDKGVSYMEYAIQVGDKIITGSTSLMKIKNITFVRRESEEIAHMLCVSFAGIAVILTIVSAVVVILILSILMASTIRKQYRELGIMKGMGYTSRELKFQMAFKIVPVAVLGVIVGTILSMLLLNIVNVYVAKITVSALQILLMDVAILAYCFICAYVSARRIKKISVYELISE
ncbi:MAG: FtsX-like permease family protein [Lachnospiraceae bacterium]|nr:FtsX-like permease family protein [Lachnospiraceae bacterium]